MERVSEALKYKLFATTLSGKALSWFYQLPEGSITSFASFGRKFLEQYHNYRPQQKSMADLYMDQHYDETTRNYLTRFMDLTSQIFNLDSKQAVNFFVRGLVKGSYMHEKFLEFPLYNLDDLKARTEGILWVEESRRQIAKNATIAISRNNSQARESKDYGRKA